MKELKTLHGSMQLPTFFPDATRGVVKCVDFADLEGAKVEGLVVNTYHIFNSYLLNLIDDFEGIHKFMNWNHPVISDSGGFQVLSMIRENKKYGKVLDDRVIFRNEEGKKIILTPEKSIQIQIKLKSDIVICLDDCTHPDDVLEEQEKSVARTISWARKCKDEFEKLTAKMEVKPLLFGVIQGGNSFELRKKCADALIEMGFDGYGFGGFPIDAEKNLISDILQYTADLMPNDKPKYALGVGSPKNLVECYKMGYRIFDCVMPTRDARHKRLFVFKDNLESIDVLEDDFCDHVYYDNEKFIKDPRPVSKQCDCLLCKHYSRAYLYHLHKAGDPLALQIGRAHV